MATVSWIAPTRVMAGCLILAFAITAAPTPSANTGPLTSTVPVTRATSATIVRSASRESAMRGASSVFVVRLNDQSINPVTAHLIVQAIAQAEADDSPVVIELDTPGGLLQSTREIVKAILSARVPVITYVYPKGSRAASAGVFITLASHVAAMAPGTNIGAAHPVGLGGSWPSGPGRDEPTTPGLGQLLRNLGGNPLSPEGAPKATPGAEDVMSEKVMNDTLAWIEGIARLRGRNVEWAKRAVTRSESITAQVALEKAVVDLVASDLSDLLRKIDGRTIAVEGREFTLRTANAEPRYLELNERQRILNVLADPTIAYILLLAGLAGLVYELTHPGLIFPGVAGLVSLLLAALALQMLPTNYAAVLLIILGIVLILAEIKFTSYGLLTVGGATCLLFGSLALVESQEGFWGVSLAVALPVVGSIVGILLLLVFLVLKSQMRPPAIGGGSLVGATGTARTDLSPLGKVFVGGTHWDADASVPVARGAQVRVVGISGLRLHVEPTKPE